MYFLRIWAFLGFFKIFEILFEIKKEKFVDKIEKKKNVLKSHTHHMIPYNIGFLQTFTNCLNNF